MMTKMDIAAHVGQIHFAKDTPIDGLSMIQLIQKDRNVKLNGQDKIRLTYEMPELADRVLRVNQVLDHCASLQQRMIELKTFELNAHA